MFNEQTNYSENGKEKQTDNTKLFCLANHLNNKADKNNGKIDKLEQVCDIEITSNARIKLMDLNASA